MKRLALSIAGGILLPIIYMWAGGCVLWVGGRFVDIDNDHTLNGISLR